MAASRRRRCGFPRHWFTFPGRATLPVAPRCSWANLRNTEGADQVMNDARIEAIELRGCAGLGVFLRVGDDQRVFRVAPVRDPRQPRFWCLAAFECSACGIPLTGDAIWAGWWGSASGELPALLDALRSTDIAWPRDADGEALRQVLLQPRPPVGALAGQMLEDAAEAV